MKKKSKRKLKLHVKKTVLKIEFSWDSFNLSVKDKFVLELRHKIYKYISKYVSNYV